MFTELELCDVGTVISITKIWMFHIIFLICRLIFSVEMCSYTYWKILSYLTVFSWIVSNDTNWNNLSYLGFLCVRENDTRIFIFIFTLSYLVSKIYLYLILSCVAADINRVSSVHLNIVPPDNLLYSILACYNGYSKFDSYLFWHNNTEMIYLCYFIVGLILS